MSVSLLAIARMTRVSPEAGNLWSVVRMATVSHWPRIVKEGNFLTSYHTLFKYGLGRRAKNIEYVVAIGIPRMIRCKLTTLSLVDIKKVFAT